MRKVLLVFAAGAWLAPLQAGSAQDVTRYVRYQQRDRAMFGVLDGTRIQELDGAPWAEGKPTRRTIALEDVRLLAPVAPSKVIAVGLNYRSHLGERPAAEYPGLFAKYPSSIIGPGDSIVMPPDASNLHYEGELVVVIGRRAKNVAPGDAGRYVFGVTAGNDVSERAWQSADLQWLRAKASDTFAPIGPVVVQGLDYGNLRLATLVNGEVRQEARTSELIFDIGAIVSYVSRYVTLEPGDVIFTGTPGTTAAMQPGDVVEIEVEGVGVLSNPVVRASGGS